jgi:hypothetical protein
MKPSAVYVILAFNAIGVAHTPFTAAVFPAGIIVDPYVTVADQLPSGTEFMVSVLPLIGSVGHTVLPYVIVIIPVVEPAGGVQEKVRSVPFVVAVTTLILKD